MFDHLPKTAGTSVRAALSQVLEESGHLRETPCPHHIALRDAGTSRFLAGHLWFYPGETLATDWFYATLLRDPIDRFISQYYFFRAHRAAVLAGAVRQPEVVAAVHLDLLEYVRHPQFGQRAANVQASHFAWRVSESPASLSESQLFDAAVTSLRDYDLVGVFADVPGFVDAYCDSLSLPRQQVPQVNVTKERAALSDLPESTLTLLRSRNAVDMELCAWARDQFLRGQAKRCSTTQRTRAHSRSDTAHRPQFGNRQIVIVSGHCEARQLGKAIHPEDPIRVIVRGYASVHEPALTVGIAVRDQSGTLVHATNTGLLQTPLHVSAHGIFSWTFVVPPLPIGIYDVTLALHKGMSHEEGCYHWVEDATSFVVVPSQTTNART